ncbi:hypothetical protein ACQ5SO_00585 [Rhodovulum sp. DZ06]|uniref:hypothetical protein n=1 Tax=Rhodovulum sp. DZ06 TaxID=3425126 RepID=UPI003D341B95
MEYGLNHLFIHGAYHTMRWGGVAAAVYLAIRCVEGLVTGASSMELLLTAAAGLTAVAIWYAVGRLKDDVLRD